MPVGVNPLNAADFDLEYSINAGGAYTAFDVDEVVDVIPDEAARKIIERLLLNQDDVLKHLGKVNWGNIRVRIEHHSAAFGLVFPWLTVRNTDIWLRYEANDTGGTNDSRLVFKGKLATVKLPEAHGDDDTAMFEFTLALYSVLWTPAA